METKKIYTNRELLQYDDMSGLDDDIFPDGKTFRFSYDASINRFKMYCSAYGTFEELRNTFSSENKAAFMMKQYGINASNRLYAINKFGYFSQGLIFDILKWIKTQFGSLDCVVISDGCKRYIQDYLMPLRKYILENDFEISNITKERKVKQILEYRDYQYNAIYSVLKKSYGRGLFEVPTGGGKSHIISGIIWNIHKHINNGYKYLILVPNKQLVEQFYKDLLEYGYTPDEVTKFTAFKNKKEGKFNPDAMIIVGNRQYIFKNKDKMPKIDVLIVDEVHQATAEITVQLIESINCKIKIGCSGTLPRDNFEKWKLVGMFGRHDYTENITNLQNKGFISKLKITLLKIVDKYVEGNRDLLFHPNSKIKFHQDEFGNSNIMFNDAYNAEIEYFNKWCVELYSPVLDYLGTLDENILILFDRIELGQKLFDEAKSKLNGIKEIHYVDGSSEIQYREHIREILESSGNNILIGQSAVFSTGINIKRLNHICFMFNTKSFSRVLQSIGRTLRLHSNKQEAHLIDIFFNYKYSQKHMKDKLKIYKDMYNKNKPDEVKEIIINDIRN